MNSKEDLEREYQRIIFWINNIDTKISFAIGASGVLLGFILSNADLSKTLKEHYKTLKLWDDSSINSGILFLLFGITIVLLVSAMWCFLSGLRAKIDPKKYHQPQMVSPSNIFWGDISKNNFYSYKYRVENYQIKDWEQDMQTQIYINSCICNQKTKFYNSGITCLKISLIGFVIYHIWLWFFLPK
ncbi:hypothetical protein OKW24_002850 [Peribacillus simplex]|uniref:hypothetical protein n=1 Tax=Peribacillus simplex TaxID=1478 RepID=UPI0024E2547B|nr:hypothetical protein [Peribacillus simplex]MDF9761077.1 hypothetical protein [Peribacillus simplex]